MAKILIGRLRYPNAPEEQLNKVREQYPDDEVEFVDFAPELAEHTSPMIEEGRFDITFLRPFTLIQLALDEGKRFIYFDEELGEIREIVSVPINSKEFVP